jgi:erythromycin esterase-like protein
MASDAIRSIVERATRLSGGPEDLDPALELIGEARFVLIGEASHGTHEFYRLRAQLTKRLVTEKGFHAVAVEADWPDAHRVHRYVKGWGHDADASDALGDFRRFPAWMWRNADVLDFVGWLRSHDDDGTTGAEKVGFYGLDLYSLHASIEAVLAYLDRRDPESAELARQRYACFEQFGGDPQRYGLAATRALTPGCEDEVVAQLLELQARRGAMLGSDGTFAEEDYFQAEQNARVVTNAEEYPGSWSGPTTRTSATRAPPRWVR